jgi:hypothetical protein
MWWTPDGERILQSAEARLFRDVLGVLVDMVRDDDEGMWQFAAPPFDALPPNQTLAVLAQVGIALRREDQPMPRLTAVLEAAVGAIYESIRPKLERHRARRDYPLRHTALTIASKNQPAFFGAPLVRSGVGNALWVYPATILPGRLPRAVEGYQGEKSDAVGVRKRGRRKAQC